MNQNINFRLRDPLPPGTVISDGYIQYTIQADENNKTKILGYGGMSIVYAVKSSNSELNLALKECWPNDPKFIRGNNGIIQPANENAADKERLQKANNNMKHEMEISTRIRNKTFKAIPVHSFFPETITISGATHSVSNSGTVFTVSEDVSEKSVTFGQYINHFREKESPPHLFTVLCLIKKIYQSLKKIHEKGYLFLDINPFNIICSEIDLTENYDNNPVEYDTEVYFLDFASAREMTETGEVLLETLEEIGTTPGYRPPELKQALHTPLTAKADLYAVGALLLYSLLDPYDWGMFSRNFSQNPLDAQLMDSYETTLGISEATRERLNFILSNTLNPDPKGRWEPDQFFKELNRLIEELRPKKNKLTLALSALSDGEFLGREEELAEIDRRIKAGRKKIELFGLGGMGKTELAIEYGRRKMETCAVYFVRFHNSMRETITGPIAAAFSSYSLLTDQGFPKTEDIVYSEVMDMLKDCNEEDILIIDNVDSETEDFSQLCGKEYFALQQLGMNIIITTRFDRSDMGGIEVGALQKQNLYELMNRILKKSPIKLAQKEMDDLIAAVGGHTLTVELIARTLMMSRPRISAQEMLKKLTAGEFDSASFAQVATKKDRDEQKRRIEGHIRTLFQISNIPETEFGYLKNAILMNEELGMPYDWFAEAQPNFNQDVMNHLFERGWIQLNQDTDQLHFHPLLYRVVKNEVSESITYFSVDGFLRSLWRIFERYRDSDIDLSPIVFVFTDLPERISISLPKRWLSDLADWCRNAMYFYVDAISQLDDSIVKLEEEYISICEELKLNLIEQESLSQKLGLDEDTSRHERIQVIEHLIPLVEREIDAIRKEMNKLHSAEYSFEEIYHSEKEPDPSSLPIDYQSRDGYIYKFEY